MPGQPAHDGDALELTFRGEIFSWRGPSPFLFVAVPEDDSAAIRAIASVVTYGWGVIPVEVRLGDTTWTTSLFPRDGRYLVPIKVLVQRAEHVGQGDVVDLELTIRA
jgi:hypothetical protein